MARGGFPRCERSGLRAFGRLQVAGCRLQGNGNGNGNGGPGRCGQGMAVGKVRTAGTRGPRGVSWTGGRDRIAGLYSTSRQN